MFSLSICSLTETHVTLTPSTVLHLFGHRWQPAVLNSSQKRRKGIKCMPPYPHHLSLHFKESCYLMEVIYHTTYVKVIGKAFRLDYPEKTLLGESWLGNNFWCLSLRELWLKLAEILLIERSFQRSCRYPWLSLLKRPAEGNCLKEVE